MTTAAPRARGGARTRVLIVVGILAVMTGAHAGCFNPRVESNAFLCGSVDQACPDGFACDPLTQLCVKGGANGGRGLGGRAATGGSGGGGAAAGGARGGLGGAGGATCANPIPVLCSVAPSAAGCDPACQTGCPCGLACVLDDAGKPSCRAPLAGPAVAEGGVCDPSFDNCAPGSICLAEPCGTNLRRCYRYCRQDTQAAAPCEGVCTLPPVSSQTVDLNVCSIPSKDCDLYAGLGNNGCPAAMNCFTDATRRFCDCPNPPAQQTQVGEPCSVITECAPGLACLAPVSGMPSRCYPLCQLGSTATCSNCARFPVGIGVGYCPLPS